VSVTVENLREQALSSCPAVQSGAQIKTQAQDFVTRRVLFAALFAFFACGMTFYLFLCLGIMADLVLRGWNPANSTGLQTMLRTLAVPISLLAGCVVFAITVRRRPPTAN
jgi:hypothetical protein